MTLDPRSSRSVGGSNGDVRFRVLRRAEVDAAAAERLLAAIVESFGTWPSFDPGVAAVDHLRWKMASPVAEIAAIVGEIDGEIATCQICLSQRVRIGGELVSRVRSTDFAVRPAFRGRGLATALATFKSDTVALPTLRLTESNAPEIQHLTRKSGALPLGNPVGAMHFPTRWLGATSGGAGSRRDGRSKLAEPALRLASAWQRRRGNGRARAIGPPAGSRIGRLERFDQRFSELWTEATAAFDVAVERTPAYLDWRYCDPRGGRWTVDAAEDAERVLGYVAWRMDGDRGVIGDLFVVPDRLDVVAALAEAAIDGAAGAGATSVLCWLPVRHPYRSVLHDRGFVSRPAGVEQLFRPHFLSSEACAMLASDATRLHFTIGDSDFL